MRRTHGVKRARQVIRDRDVCAVKDGNLYANLITSLGFRLLTNFRYGLLLAAAISMIVALYFVFNMATIAVVERRRELGLLRAIGMRR